MLCEYSYRNFESLAQVYATCVEIQNFFYGIVFYWHTLYVLYINVSVNHE